MLQKINKIIDRCNKLPLFLQIANIECVIYELTNKVNLLKQIKYEEDLNHAKLEYSIPETPNFPLSEEIQRSIRSLLISGEYNIKLDIENKSVIFLTDNYEKTLTFDELTNIGTDK